MDAWEVFQKSLMITGFVAVMMLAVEYVNIQTQGVVLRAVGEARWRQYLTAALLGATPGCLGAYLLVALYTHRCVSLGALAAGMIATSGDEMFVMLARFPLTASLMTAGLVMLGVVTGWATDLVIRRPTEGASPPACGFDLHDEDRCRCFPRGAILSQWRPPTPHRAVLVVVPALLALSLLAGKLGPPTWGWKRATLLVVIAAGVFIVSTVPEHFLQEHLWRHVALKHVPRIFAWTLGTLGALALLQHLVDLKALVGGHRWTVLVLAGLLGLIPESGPHLLFVNLFAQGGSR